MQCCAHKAVSSLQRTHPKLGTKSLSFHTRNGNLEQHQQQQKTSYHFPYMHIMTRQQLFCVKTVTSQQFFCVKTVSSQQFSRVKNVSSEQFSETVFSQQHCTRECVFNETGYYFLFSQTFFAIHNMNAKAFNMMDVT